MSGELDLLRAWLTEDRDVRSLSIDVRANDPEYVGGETDEHAVWSWYYDITAHDVIVYVGAEGQLIGVTYHGLGDTLDEAAASVLEAIADGENITYTEPPRHQS